MFGRLFRALEQRLVLKPVFAKFRETRASGFISPKEAPPISPGRISLFLIALLFISGLLLTLFYIPTAEHASNSLQVLEETSLLGRLIRNIHRWSAFLLFIFAILHALRVWLTRTFQYPRDLNWIVGLCLLLLVLILGGTGFILRWDIKAFTLMDLVISNLSQVPIIGDYLITIILGGSKPDTVPLNRGYALHIWFLPIVLVLVSSIHLFVVWRQGLAHRSKVWEQIAGRFPLGNRIHLLPGLLLLVFLLLLSWLTLDNPAAPVDMRSPWPHPDWLLMFYLLPFWFFKGQSRIIGAVIIPLILLAGLAVAPWMVKHFRRSFIPVLLVTIGIVAVLFLFSQMSSMGAQIPLQGCQACHREGMIGGAPTTLSEFDIRDPDWLIFHLRDPKKSLLVPFSNLP